MKPIPRSLFGSTILNLFFLGTSFAQQSPAAPVEPAKPSDSSSRPLEPAQILGIWASDRDSLPFLETYEFKPNGACEVRAFFEGARYYSHDGSSIKSKTFNVNQQEQNWTTQIDGDHLTLKFSDDLPACPFHRIEGDSSPSDPLVGTWAADDCGAKDWTPSAVKLRILTSNAIYTFQGNRLLYMRSRMEDAQPYTLKENAVLCPVFGDKANALRPTSQDGVVGLRASGVSKPLVRATPGDVAFRQFSPGDPTRENSKIANEANSDLKSELESNPKDAATAEKLGILLFELAGAPFDQAKFEESKKYYRLQIALQPNNPDPFFMIGCIDWRLAWRANLQMRTDYNKENPLSQVKASDALPSALRIDFASHYASLVNEGIDNVQHALSLNPDDHDALSFLSLLIRQKADLAGSETERAALLKQSDDFVAKSNAIETTSLTSNRKHRPGLLVANPPPPPPPPPPGSPSAVGGVPNGSTGGLVGGVIGGMGSAPALPASGMTRIKQGGTIAAAMCIKQVQPAYPPLARQTRISGTVRLHAILGKDGTVQQLELISGHPLLVQSAMDAVRQWVYRPTLLNGHPVEVDTTIDVIFALNDPNAPNP